MNSDFRILSVFILLMLTYFFITHGMSYWKVRKAVALSTIRKKKRSEFLRQKLQRNSAISDRARENKELRTATPFFQRRPHPEVSSWHVCSFLSMRLSLPWNCTWSDGLKRRERTVYLAVIGTGDPRRGEALSRTDRTTATRYKCEGFKS